MGHSNTTSIEELFGMEPELSKDLVATPPKSNITNLVTYFVDPK
jgi:hypothetical protein